MKIWISWWRFVCIELIMIWLKHFFAWQQAWNIYHQGYVSNASVRTNGKLNMKDLIAKMVCTVETEECFMKQWDYCPVETLIEVLINSSSIDLDDECTWTLWKKVNNKFDLQQVVGSVDSLITEAEERWPAFLLHTCCNRQQRDYIMEIRSQSSEKTFIVAQIDFSMNYTLILQREVQRGFFNPHQVTLLIIHVTIGWEHRSLASH